eukprot:1349836-Pleurochrysis_carterae.AAC.6
MFYKLHDFYALRTDDGRTGNRKNSSALHVCTLTKSIAVEKAAGVVRLMHSRVNFAIPMRATLSTAFQYPSSTSMACCAHHWASDTGLK